MNHLVFLETGTGELEKILSGLKTMLLKEFDPTGPAAPAVCPGDSLYFLRNKDECTLRVKASVVRVLFYQTQAGEDLSHTLKELQPRLQLTEEQYNYWSAKLKVLMIEFDSAQKIPVIHVSPEKIKNRSGWIAFESQACLLRGGLEKQQPTVETD